MSTKATEKIIDALTQLVEGFAELQERLEEDYDPEVADDSDEAESAKDEDEESSSIEEALVTEIRAAVEAVIENEDCAPEDLASIVSALSNALEEIDPEVFSHGTVAGEDEDEEDEDVDEDDIDLDDEDYDEDEDEEDDDEDEDEEEEEEEEDDDEDDDDDD
jgi:segregation and condensation protein B